MPKMPVYNYPLNYDEHMISVKQLVKKPVTDENYPYIDRRPFMVFIRGISYLLVCTFVRLIAIILYGLRIKDRKILKEYKEQLSKGAVTVCNHVAMWDYVFVLLALRPYRPVFPGWLINFTGKNRHFIRLAGGIPIPDNTKGLRKFSAVLNDALDRHEWVHFYPETAMWFYYDKIRPFKKRVFSLAVEHNVPVVPLVITYRKRSAFIRLFTHRPGMTIRPCPPVLPNTSLPFPDAVQDLLTRVRDCMVQYSGFTDLIPQTAKQRPVE